MCYCCCCCLLYVVQLIYITLSVSYATHAKSHWTCKQIHRTTTTTITPTTTKSKHKHKHKHTDTDTNRNKNTNIINTNNKRNKEASKYSQNIEARQSCIITLDQNIGKNCSQMHTHFAFSLCVIIISPIV